MEKRKIINLGISFLIISMCTSMFFSFFTHRALKSNGEGNWFTRRIGYFNLFGISFWSKIPFVIIISYIWLDESAA